MHYAAELGFLDVTKTLTKKCPLLLALKTTEQLQPKKNRRLLPVELALVAENDDVASYLIRMMWHERYNNYYILPVKEMVLKVKSSEWSQKPISASEVVKNFQKARMHGGLKGSN